jgi:hypothetical protein
VRNAFVGPDGSLFTIDTGDVVTQLVRRTPIRFRPSSRAPRRRSTRPCRAVCSPGWEGKKPGLEVSGPTRRPRPPDRDGDMTQSFWGDLVAVARSSG